MLTDNNSDYLQGHIEATTGRMVDVDIDGKLEMGSTGEIDNADADYSITDNGFNVTENSSFLERNTYTVGGSWGDGDDIILESRDLSRADLNLRALGGDINLNNPGSASDTNLYGFNYFERFQHQEDENRALPDTGEQELEIDAPIVRLASIDNAAILARLDMGTSPNTDRSFSFALVNDSGTTGPVKCQFHRGQHHHPRPCGPGVSGRRTFRSYIHCINKQLSH